MRDGTAWSQDAELQSKSVAAGARFGYSVAVSGSSVIVGAPGEATRAETAEDAEPAPAIAGGAAHVFVRGKHGWEEQALLSATRDPAVAAGTAGDLFGASVKLVGDTALVGAYGEDSNAAGLDGDARNAAAPNSGAVYLFTRSGDAWGTPTYIKASNTRGGDEFGRHTALASDGFVVGASNEDGGARGPDGNQADVSAPNSGAAYSFR